MSLINDALKRASQAEKIREARPQPAGALQPARSAPHGSSTGLIIGAALVLVLSCSAWFFWTWWNGRHAAAPGPLTANTQGANATVPTPQPPPTPPAKTTHTNTTPVVANIAPVIPKNTSPKTNAGIKATAPVSHNNVLSTVANTGKMPEPPAPQIVTQVVTHVVTQVVAQVTPTPVTPVNPVIPPTPPRPSAKVEFPPLQVQGIFYRQKNSSALINGRTVFVGDNIGDVKVLSIDQRSVKVELEGVTKTLWL